MIEFAEQAGLADNPECAVAHLTLGNVLLDLGRLEEATASIPAAPNWPDGTRTWPVNTSGRRHPTPGRRTTRRPIRTGGLIEPITGREQSVLRLLPSSLTPRQIAAELYLSLNTVKTHTRALYRKLDVQTRHAAIEEARRRHLL